MAKNQRARELTASITKVQMEFLDALVEAGEIATDRAGVVQHIIWREMERLKAEGKMPPKVVTPEQDDGKQ